MIHLNSYQIADYIEQTIAGGELKQGPIVHKVAQKPKASVRATLVKV